MLGSATFKEVQCFRKRPNDSYTKRSPEAYDRTGICHSRASKGVIYEDAFDCVAQHCDPFHQLVIRVCLRWLRSEPPSQCVGPLRMGWSKSKLVPKAYGPYRRSHGQWKPALLQVIAFGVVRLCTNNYRAGRNRPAFLFLATSANSTARR
jgi:hypothetical protein